MTRRRCLLLLCALASGGIVTGCGGSGSPSTTAKHTTTATNRPNNTATAPLAVRVRASIVACRKQVERSPDIRASEKPAATADCNGIKTGNIAPLRKIFDQACLRAVARLPLADQPTASKACKRAYGP